MPLESRKASRMRKKEQLVISKSVAECLRKQLPAGETLSVRVICTSDHPVDSLTPQRKYGHFSATSTLSRRVLILVSQNSCLVSGIEAHEFVTTAVDVSCSLNNSSTYSQQEIDKGPPAAAPAATVTVNTSILKVDTTGELTTRMPLARTLVAGYLHSLQRFSCVGGVTNIGVHLFARAQPEYLFAQSKKSSGKHILSDMALIKWWQGTMHLGLGYAVSAGQSQDDQSADPSCAASIPAHIVIPGSTQSEASLPLLSSSVSNTDNNGLPAESGAASGSFVKWVWGSPYPKNDLACNCVLQFPDDPITRLLSERHGAFWSVSMLFEMLAISEECGSGHRTAYISASIPVASLSPLPSDLPEQSVDTADEGALSFDAYDDILVALFDHEMDFSDREKSASSTARLDAYLDSKHSIPVVTVTTSGPPISQKSTGTSLGNNPSGSAAAAPKVNDLTMAVRKKRKVEM
ncbi:hypothetical protein GGI11_003197 [Coemansia sp. RSA 2049]|nr:hypothetical protein GGI11_003197 [Coemansia sp. RSA 2049]